MLDVMTRRRTDHELDTWLARNGYGHAGHAAKMIRQEPTGREVYAAHERDGHLTTAGRRALRADQFALPPGPEEKRRGFKGRLPIEDLDHAHAALTRISQMHHLGHLSAGQVAAAKRKIHKAWPSIKISHATKARTIRAEELGHPDRIMIGGKHLTVVSNRPTRLRDGTVKFAVNTEYSTVAQHVVLPADEMVEVGWV